jgi:hypothetical protein
MNGWWLFSMPKMRSGGGKVGGKAGTTGFLIKEDLNLGDSFSSNQTIGFEDKPLDLISLPEGF